MDFGTVPKAELDSLLEVGDESSSLAVELVVESLLCQFYGEEGTA